MMWAMSDDHPWRRLRDLTDWTLLWERLPEATAALIDWSACTITVDINLSQAGRRCAIAHELEHVARGPSADPREETLVEQAAACRLVGIDELADAVRWTGDAAEMAEELWVDADMLAARLAGLTPAQRRVLDAVADDVRGGGGKECGYRD